LRQYDEDVANQVDSIYKLSLKEKPEESEDNYREEFYQELDNLFKNIQVMERDAFDKHLCDALGKCLASVFHSSYSLVLLPTEKTTEESYQDILSRPLYQLFRFLCEGKYISPTAHSLVALLSCFRHTAYVALEL